MASLPPTFKRLVVKKLTHKFREAIEVETVETAAFLKQLKPNEVVLRNHYWGINASDVNFTAGRYDPRHKPPFTAGFEAIGIVEAIGSEVKHLKVGAAGAVMSYGAFSEIIAVSAASVIPLPAAKKEYLSLLVTGLTSSIALEQQGRMTTKEKVLVTAAAGGAGQIAVRLAKLAGNYVIGTCSSDDKVKLLQELGCDRVINYKKENFGQVLKKEFPKGIDIIYESVGGEFFQTCMQSLATRGRMIIIGSMSQYQTAPDTNKMSDAMSGEISTYQLLTGSKSVSGFFLNNHSVDFPRHLMHLIKLLDEGQLKPALDDKFFGLHQIFDAVDHLQSGKNVGKVVVQAFGHSKI